MIRTRRAPAILVGVAVLSILGASAAAAGEDGEKGTAPRTAVSKEEAKEALDRYEKDCAAGELALRLAAFRKLAEVPHPKVAAQLLKELKREKDPDVIGAILEGLSGQGPSVDKIGPTVVKLLATQCESIEAGLKRQNPGFLVDRATGAADASSAAGKRALAVLETRDRMMAAGMRCLLRLDFHERLDPDHLGLMLQSAEDELVLAVLEAVVRFEEWSVLPAVYLLFKMYPRENRWETGSALDLSGTGTQETAKARWMLVFGHPKKQKPRPEIVKAIKRCVEELTGTEVEDPGDLEALLRRKDVKAKIEGAARRRH